MLLKQLLNNLPFSLDGPLTCFTHGSIRVNVFIEKNIYYIYNYVHKLWKTVCSEINISFLRACFFKMLETITLKRLLEKMKKTFNSISTTNQTNIW